MLSLVLAVLAALSLDVALGEPRRWHPLVAFGGLAQAIERVLNPAGCGGRFAGVLAWCLAVLPPTLLVGLLLQIPYLGWCVQVLALYLAIGLRSLAEPWADTTTPAGRMVLTFFAGVAEFERSLIHERTSAGRAAAKAKGRQASIEGYGASLTKGLVKGTVQGWKDRNKE